MTEILLATCADLPDGEPNGELLVAAFARLGARARWVRWDDPDVRWQSADAVAVRSTWDYDSRREEFLAWADRIGPTLLNGAALMRWNTDKIYLVDLGAAGAPAVPSVSVDRREDLAEAVASMAESGGAVVKPRVGIGGRGLVVVRDDSDLADVEDGPWLVQPLVESIHDVGEMSVFCFDGRAVSQVRKVAPEEDVRVHPHHGGYAVRVELDPVAAVLAQDAVAATRQITGAELVYARVDLLEVDGALKVSEIEVTEPGLYLDLIPENADRFAEAVLGYLR